MSILQSGKINRKLLLEENTMNNVLKIVGIETADYFQIRCADCDVPTKNSYEGWDPSVPFFTATCEKCGKTGSWKLDQSLWQGLPPEPHNI